MSPKETPIPTVVLLLRSPRLVAVEELVGVVEDEIDDDAASTVAWVGENGPSVERTSNGDTARQRITWGHLANHLFT